MRCLIISRRNVTLFPKIYKIDTHNADATTSKNGNGSYLLLEGAFHVSPIAMVGVHWALCMTRFALAAAAFLVPSGLKIDIPGQLLYTSSLRCPYGGQYVWLIWQL